MNGKNLRKYGQGPFKVAVIHGGPGAPGEVKPLAEKLSEGRAVLEPFQTAPSIEGQVDELKDILEEHGDVPVTLIGYSWGAWLSTIFSAIYSPLVSKVILVGSPPFRQKYASKITETRLKRLDGAEREETEELMEKLDRSGGEVKKETLVRLEKLVRKADSFDPFKNGDRLEDVEVQPEIYRRIWDEASEVRKSGELLELVRLIECTVVAIHGDYDPHPGEGVREPLSKNIEDFRFVLLEKCGHTPWNEKQARDKFYAILEGLLK